MWRDAEYIGRRTIRMKLPRKRFMGREREEVGVKEIDVEDRKRDS